VLVASIQAYHGTYNAYPGPLADEQIYVGNTQYPAPTGRDIAATPLALETTSTQYASTGFLPRNICGAENLALGLLGGLRLKQVSLTPAQYAIVYDPSLVGQGPMSLNPNNVQKSSPYCDTKYLSWSTGNRAQTSDGGRLTGKYEDDAGAANDTMIPEILDQFPDGMPILYLRARRGVTGAGTHNVIREYPAAANSPSQTYDVKEIYGYVSKNGGATSGKSGYIGEGRSLPKGEVVRHPTISATDPIPHGLQTVSAPGTSNGPATLIKGEANPRKYYYPFDAYAYFEDPSNRYSPAVGSTPARQGLARAKDSFILISAGRDRVYGTRDDICSFGQVAP
jgi:hypothetical protein